MNRDELIERLRDELPPYPKTKAMCRDAAALIQSDGERIEALEAAAGALIADVRGRYPGEEFRCEYMRTLDAALAQSQTQSRATDV